MNMSDVLIFPATVEGVQTRTDLTLKVVIGTQEATPYAARLVMLNRKFVYVAIKETEFLSEERQEINEMEAEFIDDRKKRPSRRLRDVLYRLWQQDNKGFEDHNLFYLHEMERIIEHYKGKLD